jgi:hypothetical protein
LTPNIIAVQDRADAPAVPEEFMAEIDPTPRPPAGQWGLVTVAWLLVGVPLLWGVWNTLLKAAALFR